MLPLAVRGGVSREIILSFNIVKGIDWPDTSGCLVVADKDVSDVYRLSLLELNKTV